MKAGKVGYARERLYYYRQNRSGSIMNSPVTVKNVESLLVVMKNMYQTYSDAGVNDIGECVFQNLNGHFSYLIEIYMRMPDSVKSVAQKFTKVAADFMAKIGLPGSIDAEKITNPARMIWYGAGNRCKILLNGFQAGRPHEIWDINASGIANPHGIPVLQPNYSKLRARTDWLLVICVDSENVIKSITDKCSENDFRNVCDWRYYLASGG
jgi:hypothetical protein